MSGHKFKRKANTIEVAIEKLDISAWGL